MWTRSLSLLSLFTWSSHAKQWEYHFLVPFQELIGVLHIVTLSRTHLSSSYCYTFASHACNLDFWFIYNLLLSFDYFQVTIQHDTIEVHEYCWDSLKGSPRLLLFSVIVHESSQKISLPCRIWMAQVPKLFPTCGIKL